MSYIDAIYPNDVAVSRPMTGGAGRQTRPALGGGSPGRLSASIEVLLLACMLPALSLVLCVVAAGAF